MEHADSAVRVRQELDPAGVGQPREVPGHRRRLGQAEAVRQFRPAWRHAVAPEVCLDGIEDRVLPGCEFPHGPDLLLEFTFLRSHYSTRAHIYALCRSRSGFSYTAKKRWNYVTS